MQIEQTRLAGVKIIRPKRITDTRGHFQESWHAAKFAQAGLGLNFVQENQSFSRRAGTLRGLHYQAPPYAQDKLVRVVTGEIMDVAVDARHGSATYGQWTCAVLSATNGRQMLVPQGFLHGFVTLMPNTTVIYKVTAAYAPECDGAVRFDDPALGIDWGVPKSAILMSEKDAAAPAFTEWESPFLDTGMGAAA